MGCSAVASARHDSRLVVWLRIWSARFLAAVGGEGGHPAWRYCHPSAMETCRDVRSRERMLALHFQEDKFSGMLAHAGAAARNRAGRRGPLPRVPS